MGRERSVWGALLAIWSIPTSAIAADDAPLLSILADLASPNPEQRITAVRRAGQSGHPLFLDPLRAILLRGDVSERAAAADALGDLGVPASSVDLAALLRSLTAASYEESDTVAASALRALGRYPFPEVRRALGERARDPKAPPSRREIAKRSLAAPLDGEATARFTAYLEVTKREAESARTSVELAESAPPPEIRWRVPQDSILFAARALLSPERTEDERAAAILAAWPNAEESVPFLIGALRDRENKVVRRALARGLARHDRPEVRLALAPALDDPDAVVRQAAVEGIGRSQDASAAKLLVGRLAREANASLRRAIVDQLRAGPPDPIAGELLRWDPKTPAASQREAIELAASLHSALAADVLVKLMLESRPRDATLAREHLDARPLDEVLLPLSQALKQGESKRAIEALAARDAPEVTEVLLSTVEVGAGGDAVLSALSTRPEEEVRPRLIASVTSDDPKVRGLALKAIEPYRGDDVVAALVAVLARSPDDARAFELLAKQPPDLTLAPMLELLASDAHAQHHARIMSSLEGRLDARIPEPVAKATIAQPYLAGQAIAILREQRFASVRPALIALAGAGNLPDDQRSDAVHALGGFPLSDVEAPLKRFAADDHFPVRRAARNTLHDLAPEKYPSWDPYGRIPLVVEGAGFGAVMMLVASDIAGAKLSPWFTGGVGLVLGSATPFLLTLNEDVTLGDAGYFGTVGLWGTLGGWGLGRSLGLSPRDTRWATLGGEVLGVGLGALTMKWVEWGLDDVAFANFSVLEVSLTTAGIHALLVRDGTDRLRESAFAGMIGGAVATIPMALLSRRLQVEDDLALLATTMTHGAWLGLWIPGMLPEGLDPQRAAAGAVLGQGVGYLAGLVWAQFGDLTPRAAAFSGVGAAIGGAALGGLGLTLENDGTPTSYALLAGGSAAGALALGIVEPYLEFGPNDAAVIAIATAGGALAGSDLSVRIEEKRFGEPSFPGGILLGAGVGAATGLLISQLTDVSNTELWTTLGGGLLFAVGGSGVGFMLPELDVRTRGRISSAFIASGLALSYPFAEKLDLSAANVAYMGLGASAFGFWGSFLPEYWHADGEEITAGERGGGAMLGASLGAASALAVAQALDFNGGDVLLATMGSIAGSGVGAGLGLLVPRLDRRATVGLMQGVGFAGLATMTGLLAADVISPRGSVGDSGALAVHAAMFAAQGAWQGALLPFLWREDRPPSEEIAGGVIIGTSVGALAGITAIHLLDRPIATIDLVEATTLAGIATGIGGGITIAADDARIGAGVMEGLGLGAYAAGLALAPHTDYSGGALTLISAPPLFGWFGFWIPNLFREAPQLRRQIGASLAGASLGALAGATFVQLRDERDEAELWAAAIAGTGIGAGIGGLFADPQAKREATAASEGGREGFARAGPALSRRSAFLIEGGGLAALGAALALAPYTEYGSGDLALLGLGTAAGGATGVFLPALLHDASDATSIGYGVSLGSGFGLAASMALAQLIEPAPGDVLEAGLLTAAAGAIGGGLALMGSDFSQRQTALSVQIAALSGLAGGALLAPYTQYTAEDATLISLLATAGAWHGQLTPAIYESSPSDRQRGGGALLGAGAGSLLGVAVGRLRPLDFGDQLETAIYAAAGNAIGAGSSYLISGVSRRERAVWIDAAGLPALALGIALSPYTEMSGRDLGLTASLSVIGAWNGLWLSAYLRPDSDPLVGTELGGGAAVGAGAGLLTGVLASQFLEVSALDQLHAQLAFLVASGIGAGTGLLIPSLDRRATLALMQGAGAAGLIAGLSALTSLDYEGGDFALVPLGTFFGAALGLTLPTFVRSEGDVRAEERGGGALLGASLGAATTAALAQFTAFEADDVWEAGAFSVAGAALGMGLGLAVPESGRRLQFGIMDGATVAGLTAGLLLAPYTDYDDRSYLNLGLGTLIGTTLGAVAPVWYGGHQKIGDIAPETAAGGAMVGAGLGLGAGLLMDQVLHTDGDTRENVSIGAAVGALSGAGIGLAASTDDRWAVGLASGLTLAGAAGVGLTAKRFEYDWADVALGTAYVGYLTWHSSGLTLLLDGSDRQAVGVALSTVGLGALTGMYLTPYLSFDLADVLMLLAGNVWGTWIGGWGGEVFKDRVAKDLEGRRGAGLTLLASVLGSDVGLTVTGLVVGGLLDVPPMQFAVINLSGLGGMMVGMLSAGFAKSEPLKEGNVIGALSGLILGAVVTSFFDWQNATTWDQLLAGNGDPGPVSPRPTIAHEPPKAKGAFTLESWFPSATVQPGPEGEEQYLFTLVGTW